ncbi:MAG TPA: hypothetical protein VF678_06955, partial [bacterium]
MPITPRELELLEQVEKKVLWLSTYLIHHANKIRPNPDAIKVGGHQASTASVVSLLTALMVRHMGPRDRLALKPHSSPAFHALHYLLGNLPGDKLKAFREFGGIQSYPSRRKDPDEVHFNTGSVGLGGVNAMFGAVVQNYARQHFPEEQEREGQAPGRYISLMGDAEMEEGTLYEAMIEAQNYHLRDCWWIIDLNRQSLDKLLHVNRVQQLHDIFQSMGWEVIVLKYSRSLLRLFEQPGGEDLKQWFDDVSNAEYQTLLRLPPEEYKKQLVQQVGSRSKAALKLVEQHDGVTLRNDIMHLGGHDLQMITEAFDKAARVKDRPVAILAYTIKGYSLPLAGHKDNHSGLLNEDEIETLRSEHNVPVGHEWEALAGVKESKAVAALLEKSPLHTASAKPAPLAPQRVTVPPELNIAFKEAVSTQAAFGQLLMELSRVPGVGDRMVTTAPDVAISTNLGGWINKAGIYQPEARRDFYEQYKLTSPFRGKETPKGKHLELGIAENNFFSLLGTLGLSYELNGTMLLPIGTVYDVFLNRGLDMLTNAIYSESRFLLVGTPSGVTLAPEGGAHQSFLSPLMGLGFPEFDYFEPSYAKELEAIICWSLEQIQDRENGRPVYLRLTTNPLAQPDIQYTAEVRRQIIAGGYWLRDYRHEPDYAQRPRFNLVSTGVMTDQALHASTALREEGVYANVIVASSPGRLYRGWSTWQQAGVTGGSAPSPHLFDLIPPEERHPMVSVIDGHP